jgi:hypothetical protein
MDLIVAYFPINIDKILIKEAKKMVKDYSI